jgi:hypothetical protein
MESRSSVPPVEFTSESVIMAERGPGMMMERMEAPSVRRSMYVIQLRSVQSQLTEQEPKTFTLNYKGKDVECDKVTGQVVDRAELGFPTEAVVKFQGGTDSPDWKDLKVSP